MDNNDDRIERLEAKVAELTAMLEASTLTAVPPTHSGAPNVPTALLAAANVGPQPTQVETAAEPVTGEEAATSSRRGMLKLDGAAAVGAIAATATGVLPAAADNGIVNTDQNLPTQLNHVGTADAPGFLFTSGVTLTPAEVGATALAAFGGGPIVRDGLLGVTLTGGYGTVGIGLGGGGVGVLASGTAANIELAAGGTAPTARTDFHFRGEIICDTTGTMWACVADGTPGSWRKLAGTSTAGSFHALTPGRVYDSRAPQPSVGPLTGGQGRTISVADKREPSSGVVTAANFVPAGATAVTANVTIISLSGAGFLTVNPGGVTAIESSTINWFAAGQVLANGVSLTLNTNRQLTVVAGGAGSTDFLIDISGYFL